MGLKYNKAIDDFSLSITDENIATMSYNDGSDDTGNTVIVTLESNEEADKLVKEFEDADGELCHKDDAIMTKYTEFHPFRP